MRCMDLTRIRYTFSYRRTFREFELELTCNEKTIKNKYYWNQFEYYNKILVWIKTFFSRTKGLKWEFLNFIYFKDEQSSTCLFLLFFIFKDKKALKKGFFTFRFFLRTKSLENDIKFTFEVFFNIFSVTKGFKTVIIKIFSKV